jgi:hypothetical protein
MALSSCVNFRNGQTFGSLQHAPQLTHSPLRLSETGNIAVKVLFVLASQVFLLTAINRYFPNDSVETIAFTNINKSAKERFLRFSEDRDDVLDLHHEKPIVTFEIDGNGAFGIEQHLVVLAQRYIRRAFDLGGNCDDSAGDCGNFDVVRELDPALGLFLVLVLANQDALAYRLDSLKRIRFCLLVFTHFPSTPAK